MSDTAKIFIGDKEMEFPIVTGTENERGIDIKTLRSQLGVTTLDDGFMSTAACQSAVTYLNGEEGILRYRGYPIEQLAEKSTFLEVAYLLINQELPTQKELDQFKKEVTYHTLIHEDLRRLYDNFPKSAHPMAILSSMIGTLSAFYEDTMNPLDQTTREISIYRLIAKAPTIAAFSYKKSIGQPTIFPRNDMGYTDNFCHMLFATPAEEYEVDPIISKAIDVILILHADHEQNCSTSTVRLVGSSQANLFASVAAGVYALWGPLHGGANQAVLEMLEAIHKDGGSVDKFIAMAKDKSSQFRLMGFGHRVYKNFDPRATVIKKTCDEVLNKLGIHDPLLEIATKLEKTALEDPYFQERKLYPNIDFYSGIIYRAIGIPTNMFTVLFALGRLPGWIAQWQEMISSPGSRIGRPRQVYTGSLKRDYHAY